MRQLFRQFSFPGGIPSLWILWLDQVKLWAYAWLETTSR